MKGQIASWHPYVKDYNYSFYYYCWCHLGENFLIDQDESLRGSVMFPYLSVKEKADSHLSGLVEEQHFPQAGSPSSSWSSDFFPACEQRNPETVQLVFAASCPAHLCQGRTAVTKGREAPRKYVHSANNWRKMILLFRRNLDFCLKETLLGLTITRVRCQSCSIRTSVSLSGTVG